MGALSFSRFSFTLPSLRSHFAPISPLRRPHFAPFRPHSALVSIPLRPHFAPIAFTPGISVDLQPGEVRILSATRVTVAKEPPLTTPSGEGRVVIVERRLQRPRAADPPPRPRPPPRRGTPAGPRRRS